MLSRCFLAKSSADFALNPSSHRSSAHLPIGGSGHQAQGLLRSPDRALVFFLGTLFCRAKPQPHQQTYLPRIELKLFGSAQSQR